MQNFTALPKIIRAHVFISGRVQGVGYRYATVNTASQLGLTGWVRNLPDSRVEAVFEGAQEVVNEMVRWCHSGPPAAVVKDVVVEYEVPEGLRRFEVKRGKQFRSQELAIATPNGELKWNATEPQPGKFTFESADAIADFCQKYNMELHGHTLFWHTAKPDWVPQPPTLEMIERHVTGVMGHYRNSPVLKSVQSLVEKLVSIGFETR